MNETLVQEIEAIRKIEIPAKRITLLQPLISYIKNNLCSSETVNLNFICTHNSRRSHLCQVWAQTAAGYFGISGINCYSGGTEATALFPMIAQTLTQSGFEINSMSGGDNPIYTIKFGPNSKPIIGFSKLYNDPFNPESNFAAILTCSQVEQDCPVIIGTKYRISIPYEDPKAFDNTPIQDKMYHERSSQIASEMFYIFSEIVKN